MNDYIIRAIAANDQIRAFAAVTTETVETARQDHNTSPVATAALGRLLTAGAMMGTMMKGDKDILTLQIKAGGPLEGITVTADSKGRVKGYVGNPDVCIPANSKGKLDVAGAVGVGFMDVIKDMGLKEPYVGTIELVSGELGIDFAQYFTVSEQQPSLVSLGVLVNGDVVLKAGGLLVQPMPGCEEETLEQLELRSPMFADISREMTEAPKEQLLEDWFRGMKPVVLDRTLLRYHCGCSRARMEKALISLGRKELQTIIDEDTGAELGCHFCHQQYQFTTEELKQLLEKATRE